jgi:hypothetical protein
MHCLIGYTASPFLICWIKICCNMYILLKVCLSLSSMSSVGRLYSASILVVLWVLSEDLTSSLHFLYLMKFHAALHHVREKSLT